MNVILFNFSWMSFNIFLALVAVTFGWLFLSAKNRIMKSICGLIWLLFVPNTIYLFTDLINLMSQWGRYNDFERLVFIFQYGLLEIVCLLTFIASVYPFEKFISGMKSIKNRMGVDMTIFILNFIIGFGITLGRVERINSWEVFIAPLNVLDATQRILVSPQLLILTVLFSLFGSFLYFLLRKPVLKYLSTYLSQVVA